MSVLVQPEFLLLLILLIEKKSNICHLEAIMKAALSSLNVSASLISQAALC